MKNLRGVLKPSEGQYDVVAMLSGGKDSILMVHHLLSTHPELRILCITYDDGFLGSAANANVEKVVQHFGLDNMIIRHDCRADLEAYLESDLPKQVDIYTFLEVFQNVFWGKIQKIAAALGGLPVITGNQGYYSSEVLLPEQYQLCFEFLKGRVVPVDVVFISYWAEETFPQDLSILDELGWDSHPNLNTDHLRVKALRERLNEEFPKETLDDKIDEKWGELTRPRFSDLVQVRGLEPLS